MTPCICGGSFFPSEAEYRRHVQGAPHQTWRAHDAETLAVQPSDFDISMGDWLHEKRCTRCGEMWPADQEFFYRDGNGLTSMCKACWAEYKRDRRVAA